MRKEKNSKYGLLKVLVITFLIFAVLTWIVPTGSYNGSTFTGGETDPVGLYGLFINPLYSFGIFVQYIVVFLAIGGLYGVLNKTGAYSKIIEGVAKKFEKKKKLFLIISIVLFASLSSLIGSQVTLFIFVPFVIALLMTLGYDKITSLAGTVGAILIGITGSIYGNSVVYKSFIGINANNGIIYRLIFFAIVTTLYILFVIKSTKNLKLEKTEEVDKQKKGRKKKNDAIELEKQEEVKKIDIPLYVKKDENKSIVPLAIILGLLTMIVFVGMFNWYYTFEIKFFDNIYESIMSFEVGGIAIFAKIFGDLPQIGYFGNYDLAAILLIASAIIGWVYGNKLNEFIDGFVKGCKEMLLPAIYVMFASIIFAVMVNSNGNISATISNFLFGLSKELNVLIISLVGFVGGFFFNDFPYLLNGIYGVLADFDSIVYPIIVVVLNAAYGIAMFILPVSITLIAGLKYMNVSYKDWVKYIWKFLTVVFVILMLFALISLAIIK